MEPLTEKLLAIIKAHTEHWMKVNGYTIPYDYHGLQGNINEAVKKFQQSKPSS